MKIRFILFYFLACLQVVNAQMYPMTDSLKSSVSEGMDTAKMKRNQYGSKTDLLTDSINVSVSENQRLKQDDVLYNPKFPLWQPILRVGLVSVFKWSRARYIYDEPWARINPEVWKKNLQLKFEWDRDGVYTNQLGHPFTGSKYYNIARANGYSFMQSIPFTVGGSLFWELFWENELPSRNDLISTTTGGVFWGEILYRISSNILDERITGRKRVGREIAAGVINPTRALNRLTSGKMFRVTPAEVYQKEAMQIVLRSGAQVVNTNRRFARGNAYFFSGLYLNYGNPFETRKRKAFDFFNIHAEIRLDNKTTGLTNLTGYAFLFGKSSSKNNRNSTVGLFQHYDYWDYGNAINLATISYGPGLISKIKWGKSSRLYSGIHFAIIPMAETRPPALQDTSVYKLFKFGNGVKGYIEERLDLSKYLVFTLTNYIYHIQSYEGYHESFFYAITKPGLLIRVFRNAQFGIDHQLNYYKRKNKDKLFMEYTRTEQRFYVQLTF